MNSNSKYVVTLVLFLVLSVGLFARVPGVYVGNFAVPSKSLLKPSPISTFIPKKSSTASARLEIKTVLRKVKGERVPLTARDAGIQLGGGAIGMLGGGLIGMIVGGIGGGLSAGAINPQERFWGTPEESTGMAVGALVGSYVGIATGIWMAGNDDHGKGSYFATLGGVLIGGGVGMIGAVATFGILSPAAILFPYAGGLIGYNLTRRAPVKEESEEIDFGTVIELPTYDRSFSAVDSRPVTPTSVPGTWTFQVLNLRF